MSTPPHNWGVPRKIISRRRGWSNKSRGLALALKVWPFFASFHLPPSGSVVPLAIFSSTYCFAEIKVKSWEVERSKKEMECDAEVEFLNFNYCSLPAHLLLTSCSPHHPLIPKKWSTFKRPEDPLNLVQIKNPFGSFQCDPQAYAWWVPPFFSMKILNLGTP